VIFLAGISIPIITVITNFILVLVMEKSVNKLRLKTKTRDVIFLVIAYFTMNYINMCYVTLLETYRFPDGSIFESAIGKLGESDFTPRWYEEKGVMIMLSVIIYMLAVGLFGIGFPALLQKILQWKDRGWTSDRSVTK